MTEIMNKKETKFSWKAFISLWLTYSFIIIFLTGIVLYLTPSGRIAHWSNWTLLGFSKEEWQSIHIVFSFIFAILSIFHLLFINWKVFLTYLKSKKKSGLNKKKEFYLASVFTILVFFGVIFSIPPFSSVINFGDYLTDSWESIENEPPIPHAELLTLDELTDKIDNLSIEKIIANLNVNNIRFNNTNEETLEEIGKLNNLSPIEIYNTITTKINNTNKGENDSGSGLGIGRKTIEKIAMENNKNINDVLEILKKNDIDATKTQTLKDLASENNVSPKYIYELIK